MTRRARIQHLAAGCISLALALGCAAVALWVEETTPALGTTLLLGMIFAYFAVYLFLAPKRVGVVLHADAIEVNTVLRRRRLSRAEIAGYRVAHGAQGPAMIRLVPFTGAVSVLLPQYLDLDGRFEAWMAAFERFDAPY
jgi:hypothetical protein